MEAVVRLQGLDERIAALQKEIDALPKHVAEIETKLAGHIRQLDSDRAALAANVKGRKQLEDDIKVQELKIAKLRDQMLQAKTNEQYRAFQHEIEYCETAIRKAEDKILDFMESAEPLEKNVKGAEVALAEEKKSVEAEKEDARKRTAADKEALAAATAERKDLAGRIEPRLLAKYEHARRRWHGSGVSDATNGRCAACNMMLRPQFFQDLRKGEHVQTCESCGRILYYNPPVDLVHEMHQEV